MEVVQDSTAVEPPKEQEMFKSEDVDMSSADLSPIVSALSGPKIELEPMSFDIERTSETLVSSSVGASDFESTKVAATNAAMDKRNSATYAAMFDTRIDKETARNILTTVANAPMPKLSTGDAVAYLSVPTAPANVKTQYGSDVTVANARQINNDGAKAALNMGDNYEAGMKSPNPVATALISSFDPSAASDSNSFNDWLEFINPIGGAKTDGMDLELFQMTKDVFTGDFDSDEFGTKMESNYGEDWGKRFAGFLVKEVAIDVGILALAMTGVGAPVAAALKLGQVGLKAKLIAGVGRSAIIAAGGGAAQVAQNASLGRDLNAAQEVGVRFAGGLGGEVVGAGVGKGFRYFQEKSLKSANKSAAESMQTIPMSKDELFSAITEQSGNVGAHAAMTRTNLFSDVKKYGELTNNLADGITDKKLGEEVRVGLANHLGRNVHDFDDIPLDVILPKLLDDEASLMTKGMGNLASDNQKLLGHSLLYPLLARVDGDMVRMNNIRQLYFNQNGVSLRETGDNINRSTIPIMNDMFKVMGVAEPVKDAFQSASNWLSAKNFAANQEKGFRTMQAETYKGLTKKEINQVHAIARKGDGDETVYDFLSKSPSDMGEISPKVQQAYAKFRFTQDLAYEVADAGKVAAFKDSVFKLDSGEFVQIAKSTENAGSGKVFVRAFDRETMQAGGKAEPILKTALEGKNIDTIIPYRQGHVPRVYRDQKHSVLIIDTNPGVGKGGTVAREASFDSGKEAQEYVASRNAVAKEGETAIKIMNNTETGAGSVAAHKSSIALLSGMDDATAASVRNQLAEVGIDDSAVRVLFDTMVIPNPAKAFAAGRTNLGVATTKKSQDLRLQHAEAIAKGGDVKGITKQITDDLSATMPISRSSMLEYFSSVAHGAGHDNWRVLAFKDWEKRYADVMGEGSDSLRPTFIKPTTTAHRDMIKEAKAYSKWLQRAVKDRSKTEQVYDQVLAKISDDISYKAANGNVAYTSLSKLMDSIPMAKQLEADLRFVAAFPKLLALNFAQIFVQGSQSVLSVGAAAAFNPALAMRSMFKLAQITGLEAARKLGTRVPSAKGLTSARTVHEELLRSGYIADLSSMDTMFSMKHGVDPSVGRKAWENTKNVMQAPFRFGEAINRVTAYVTVRDQLAYAIIKGKNPVLGFDGVPMTKADIGTPAFMEAVVDKASVLALNMGKAGELRATSGAGSVLWQFKQVLFKEMSVMDSSKLLPREKFGGAAAMIGMFGFGAIPLAADLLHAVDWINSSTKDPNSRYLASEAISDATSTMANELSKGTTGWLSAEDIERVFKSGAISAATEGEWNFANRVALGNFVSDMVDVQQPQDMIVSVAVVTDMLEAVKAISGLDAVDLVGIKAAATVGGGVGVVGYAGVRAVLNVHSFIEIYSKVNSGVPFAEAFSHQFAPDSAIGKYISKDVGLGSASLQVAREAGKVFSQLGSYSRILDSANRDLVAPEADSTNPASTKYYTTSSGKGTPVEATRMRNIQLLLGITPGKLVNAYKKQDKERMYSGALKDYDFALKKRLRDAMDSTDLQRRIRKEASEHLFAFKDHMTKYGLDVPSTANPIKSITKTIIGINRDVQSGGQAK